VLLSLGLGAGVLGAFFVEPFICGYSCGLFPHWITFGSHGTGQDGSQEEGYVTETGTEARSQKKEKRI